MDITHRTLVDDLADAHRPVLDHVMLSYLAACYVLGAALGAVGFVVAGWLHGRSTA